MTSLPMSGPCMQLTPVESARVLDALQGHTDETARAIAAKCARSLNSDPRWRTAA